MLSVIGKIFPGCDPDMDKKSQYHRQFKSNSKDKCCHHNKRNELIN